MTTVYRYFFSLLRIALYEEKPNLASFRNFREWQSLYDLSSAQGVLAIVWDGLQKLPPDCQPSRELRLKWAYNVERIELYYRKQRNAITRLAAFYRSHDLPLMLLKGYGLSLSYPVPEHRPCGDIDIWLYGRQQEADDLMRRCLGIPIEEDVHHHTTFRFDGILVENHYDFVNVHAHASNRKIEYLLKEYSAEPCEKIDLEGHRLYLPPVQFNALFLLRHAAMHFAAEKIGMRHVVDWTMFVDRYSEQIDWKSLDRIAREMNMHRFLYCLNAIAIDCLGLDAAKIPAFERNPRLEQRVLAEIMNPSFDEKTPHGNIVRIVWFKFRRWWANRWKHRIVYREGLFRAFIQSAWSHLLKPKTIAH